MEECEDLQKQRRAVEGEVREILWSTSTVHFPLGARTSPGVKPPWTELRDGKQRLGGVCLAPEKGRRRDVGRILHKDGEDCKNGVDKDEAANSI